MSGKTIQRRVRDAAAQLEIDRAIVARRLAPKEAGRTILRLPLGETTSHSESLRSPRLRDAKTHPPDAE